MYKRAKITITHEKGRSGKRNHKLKRTKSNMYKHVINDETMEKLVRVQRRAQIEEIQLTK